MKTNNKYFLGLGLVALIVTTLAVSGFVSASENVDSSDGQARFKNFKQQMDPVKMEEMKAHKEAMKQVLENNDYEAWKNLVSERPNRGEKVLEKITEENFAKFVEMHNYLESKDIESAKAIAAELGLEKFKRPGKFKNNKSFKAGYEKGLGECRNQ